MLTMGEAMSTKMSAVEDSIANIKEQMKTEVERFMKVQTSFSNRFDEQTV